MNNKIFIGKDEVFSLFSPNIVYQQKKSYKVPLNGERRKGRKRREKHFWSLSPLRD